MLIDIKTKGNTVFTVLWNLFKGEKCHFVMYAALSLRDHPKFSCRNSELFRQHSSWKVVYLICRLCDRYSGPNTGNVHIIADLYAEVIGVLTQSK